MAKPAKRTAKAKARTKAPKVAKAKTTKTTKTAKKTGAKTAKKTGAKAAKKTGVKATKKTGAKAAQKTGAKGLQAPAFHERFDRAAYDLPAIDLAEAIALASRLLAVRPAKATPAIAEEAKRVATARDRARAVHAAQSGGAPSVDARAYDVAMDRAWATFVRRIEDHVELPGSGREDAGDVATIYRIVGDLSILRLNYLAEFAQIGARLDALKREGLLDVAAALTGKLFLDEVLRCHGEYGQALGVMPVASPSDGPADRGEARLSLVDAVAEYAAQVMAQARAGRLESWEPVRKALAPIAELRARQQRALRTSPPPADA